jgi:hypothetical protein
MATTTPNYALNQPDVGGSANVWGDATVGLNANMAIIDTELKRVDNLAGGALPKAGGSITGAITGGAGGAVGTPTLPILDARFAQWQVSQPAGAVLASCDITGVITAVNVLATSDARLKENVQPLPAMLCLAAVCRLQPVTFRWIQGQNDAMGLIAQDVQCALPLAVNAPTEGYFSLSQPALIAALVGAVVELTRRIEQLESVS